jgi:Fe/S biogenesis protein NfuA
MESELIALTDEAKKRILSAFEKQPDKVALRVEANVSGTSEFSYEMKLVGSDEKTAEDLVVESGELQVVLDPKSAEYLTGATIDYEDGIVKSGFKFINPNKPEIPEIGSGPRSDLSGPLVERVQHLIESELNPAVAAHGGRMELLEIRDNKAYLSFGGGCHGCGMVDVTLKQGVETRIRELVPEIEEVVDVTDHSTGDNPYYS